ncbi:hypothetical protein Q4F19_02805 [Sphingomonas sp. BIUV-7]|uniref:DUF4175 domain-containing protein n=1 Tax=Sphingomonas natans TaxID=3063330 RepID=A0ABT8Y4Q8_9SPHN|nr:hypothetical protein [Sphingomonas sp. BIUV-7]MDO6413302.1 hypothetical protein [Sphingomonas sp. BIUV-7]
MPDPKLILDEFLFDLGSNLLTAFAVALLILGVAVAIPATWRWWVALPVAVVVGVCLTIVFVLLGMPFLDGFGLAFPVSFGPLHLAIAILLSGAAFAIVRKRRGPIDRSGIPKPDSWYDRP